MRRIIGGIFSGSDTDDSSLLVQGDSNGLVISFTDSDGDPYETIRISKQDTIELGRLLSEIEKHQRAQVDSR